MYEYVDFFLEKDNYIFILVCLYFYKIMRIKRIKYIIFLFCLALCFVFVLSYDNQAKVSISILGKWLVIWTPNNLDLWSVFTGSILIYTFDDYFWIDDMRWYFTWHYTTVQLNGLYGPSESVITGIELKANNLDLLNWRENSTLINVDISNWLDITTPKLFFYRNTDLNNWVINRYGTMPSIRITVPDDAQTGIYRWKIIYTLYDYWVSIGN